MVIRKPLWILLAGALGLFIPSLVSPFGQEKTEEMSPSPSTTVGIRYVALLVKDMAAMGDFFEKDLGFHGNRSGSFTVFEVAPGQYFALVPKMDAEAAPGRMVVGFEVEDVDAYFKQVTSRGIQAIDPMKDGKVLDRPVYRQWGAREFGVRTPEGDILMFTRSPGVS
jgi:catechol 2,3-dioxygenase-like lactoylglutathione lyase family enzyme